MQGLSEETLMCPNRRGFARDLLKPCPRVGLIKLGQTVC